MANELSTKHQRTVDLRREVSSLEQSIQAANTTVSSAKSREQNLQQETEALNRSNEWLDQELKTKSAEYAKFRKEKLAKITELQRTNEDAATTIESLRRTEHTLRTRLEEVGQKVEEYLGQIQEMREEASRNEETFRAELDTANRLSDLMKASLDTERGRQRDLSAQLEESKEAAAEEIGRINAEVDTIHQDREAAERRVAELEVQVERLEADALLHNQKSEIPRTPSVRRNRDHSGAPSHGTPARVMSPAPSGMRGGISYTQVISDYHIAKAELEAEKRRNEKLSETIDEMIRDMEAHQPEIAELQADHARLEADVVEMSSLVDSIGKERDQARKDARKWEREVNGLSREGDLIRQQLRDLSSQIKVLLLEINAQDQGFDAFSAEERSRLQALAQGDFSDDSSLSLTDTDRFISQNLTTFRNITELQEQNTRLLRIARELGEKMEGEESRAEKDLATQNLSELEDLRHKFERSKDEIKILVTQSQSYIRERDMFRRMLSHRGQLPAGGDLASLFGESVNGSQGPATPARNGIFNTIEQSPSSKDMADYAKLLKELQSHFDSYRQEAAGDRSILKEQADNVSRRNQELRMEMSKKTSEITLAVDRYEMLHGNYTMLKNENTELASRSQNMSDRAAKQELRTQQLAEDLVEAKGFVESMRNESANLKAEKEFWKSVERRLTEDNQNLVADRDRLNTLNANLQNLINEREHADSDSRRRLQLQSESLESELQSLQRKLSEEVEENKRATLRREYDSQQNQVRIDDLVSSLGSVREELVAAKTTRDYLQAEVDELTVKLKSAEERLEVLQPRSAPNDGSLAEGPNDLSASNEQELALQVSDLKRDLILAQNELTNAKAQVEQYKAISQSSEEELQSFNETHDQYKQEMDEIIEEKDRKIVSLEQAIENLRAEITSINTEFAEVKGKNTEHTREIENMTSSYEAELVRLKDMNERSETAAQYHQEDLKAQAEIAQQAQQSYENELVKHAEAAKSLQKVRAEHGELKLRLMEFQTSAEAAQKKLTHSEQSWTDTKDRYEREIAEIKARKDDITAQNRILHQQLESVSVQIGELQKRRASNSDNESDTPSTQGTDANFQELIKYMRREKEIVDVQFELAAQEVKRLRQQLDHIQIQFEEARLKLIQLRRAEEHNERNELGHKKLLETIDELNLNRESNSTLRLEKNQIQTSLNEKMAVIEDLQAQLQPLQARIRELEDIRESQEEDLRMTREARERFEQRYLDILHRSDSIDPAEHEAIKEKANSLEIERDDLAKSVSDLQNQVNAIPNKIQDEVDKLTERHQESRSRMIEQSKAKDREQRARIRDKEAALQNMTQEKQEVEGRLQSLENDLSQANAARDHAIAQLNDRNTQAATSGDGAQALEAGQVSEETQASNAEMQDLQEQKDAATAKAGSEEARANSEAERASTLQVELDSAGARIVQLEQDIANIQQSLDDSAQEITALQTQQQVQSDEGQPRQTSQENSDVELERLHKILEQLQKEGEELKAKLLIYEHAGQIQEDVSESVADQIISQVEAIRNELTSRHETRVAEIEERHTKRTGQMKDTLNKRLASVKAEIRNQYEASNRQALDALQVKHTEELEALNARHKDELDELQRHVKTQDDDTPTKADETGIDAAIQTEGSWQPNDDEVKEFMQKNEIARKLVMNSINNREKKVKEEQLKILAEKLAEAESKANAAQEQAVTMEAKRYSVKMSMAENKAKAAQVKIDLIQTAAAETPERSVGEVWALAKDAKVVPAAGPQPAAQPKQTSTSSLFAPMQAPVQANNPFLKPPTSPMGASNATSPPAQTSQSSPTGPVKVPLSLTQSTHAPPETKANGPSSAQAVNGTQPEPAPAPQTTKLPNQPLQGGRGNNATGAAVARSLQSALPVPSGRGGAPNTASQLPRSNSNSNIGRGRGRGGPGRGGGGAPQAVDTTAAPKASSSEGTTDSPRGAAPLSATARQFVPQKRTREETGLEASQHSGDAKRARGGGQFSG